MKSDGLEVPSGDKIKEVEEGGCKYFRITELNKIKN